MMHSLDIQQIYNIYSHSWQFLLVPPFSSWTGLLFPRGTVVEYICWLSHGHWNYWNRKFTLNLLTVQTLQKWTHRVCLVHWRYSRVTSTKSILLLEKSCHEARLVLLNHLTLCTLFLPEINDSTYYQRLNGLDSTDQLVSKYVENLISTMIVVNCWLMKHDLDRIWSKWSRNSSLSIVNLYAGSLARRQLQSGPTQPV